MILFPNCKINLGLNITRKRADGYHDLETVFYPLPLRDAVEIVPFPKTRTSIPSGGSTDLADIADATSANPGGISNPVSVNHNGCLFTSTGLAVPGNGLGNLCLKAWDLVKNDFPDIAPIQMYLHKAIPIGAGLGGGSSNGAFTLLLLNQEFKLGLSRQKLLDYALQLGSDCPFFILNRPCLATGRGELMEEIGLDLSGYYFVLADPGIHISTAWAFSQLKPAKKNKPLSTIIRQRSDTWKTDLKNDFEEPVFDQYPGLLAIRDELYEAGAIYASLTGTGSAVYGMFSKSMVDAAENAVHAFKATEKYKVYLLK